MKFRLVALSIVASTFGAPSVAVGQELSDFEQGIATSFDEAVRSQEPLQSLAKLPWAPGSAITEPYFLGKLRCTHLASTQRSGSTLIVYFEGTDDISKCDNVSAYYAQIKMTKGRISRISLAETSIVITSGSER